ncbi:MAG: hypothetical protein GXZ04_01560 [Clostridiales bacterium]|nr:hypothetical protein [Clostridiales bacterium]
MSELSKKVEYLKGLADGMNLKEDNQDQRLLLKILEVLEEIAFEIEDLQEVQDEMNEYLENMDEDLAELEDAVFEDEDDFDHLPDDYEGFVGDSLVEYECPHCGYKTRFDITDFDFDEDYLCPECEQPFFPEYDEEDEDELDEDENEGADH